MHAVMKSKKACQSPCLPKHKAKQISLAFSLLLGAQAARLRAV
jgi:hypothetical protein